MSIVIPSVVLYTFRPIEGMVSASPFCVKLEAYFLLRGIAYESRVVFSPRKAPKGKLPYVRVGDVVIADSSAVMEYFEARYFAEAPLDAWLTDAQRSEALAFKRLFEEHLYFAMAYIVWLDDAVWPRFKRDRFSDVPVLCRSLVAGLFRRYIRRMLHAQGMGRHETTEVYARTLEDLTACEAVLSQRNYFMGERLSTLDATAYGFLSPLFLSNVSPRSDELVKTFPLINDYVNRMDERLGLKNLVMHS